MVFGRKGQTVGVDFAIAMSVFVITITTGIFYAIHVSLPTSPFSQQVRSSAVLAGDRFVELNSWELQKSSVVVRGEDLSGFPVEIDYIFPSGSFKSSLRAFSENGEVPVQYDDDLDEMVFLSDSSVSGESIDFVFSRERDTGERTFSDEVFLEPVDSNFRVSNSELEVMVDENGFEYLDSDGSTRIENLDLGVSADRLVNISGSIREKVFLDGSRNVSTSLYSSSGLLRVDDSSEGSGSYTMNVSSGYDSVSVGDSGTSQEVSLEGGGTHFSGQTDYIWMTGESMPLAFFFEGMNAEIYRANAGNPLEVEISFDSGGKPWIYSSDGYGFESLRDMFYSYEAYTTVNRPVSGVYLGSIDNFETLEYGTAGDMLGLSGMNYNVSMGENFSIGEEIPGSQDIFVQEFPVAVMGDVGNISVSDMRVAVWS